MMIDFTKETNQSNLLYNTSSIQSASSINNSSTVTTTSSTASINSSNSGSTDLAINTDPYSLSFLTENQNNYNKLLEDLTIIDNMHDTLYEEFDSVVYGKKNNAIKYTILWLTMINN